MNDQSDELAAAAGRLAHELRTPLTAILANAEMLATEPAIAERPDLRSMAEGIVRAATRMNAMIGAHLDPADGGGTTPAAER